MNVGENVAHKRQRRVKSWKVGPLNGKSNKKNLPTWNRRDDPDDLLRNGNHSGSIKRAGQFASARFQASNFGRVTPTIPRDFSANVTYASGLHWRRRASGHDWYGSIGVNGHSSAESGGQLRLRVSSRSDCQRNDICSVPTYTSNQESSVHTRRSARFQSRQGLYRSTVSRPAVFARLARAVTDDGKSFKRAAGGGVWLGEVSPSLALPNDYKACCTLAADGCWLLTNSKVLKWLSEFRSYLGSRSWNVTLKRVEVTLQYYTAALRRHFGVNKFTFTNWLLIIQWLLCNSCS